MQAAPPPGVASARPRDQRLARAAPWLVGLLFLALTLPAGYLDGSAPLLRTPIGDLLQHQIGITAYLRDAWHWPPFHTRLLNAPEGTALVFVDALPGPSLLAKAVYGLTGLIIPVLGWWIALLYLLQPVAFARLLRALGVRDWRALLAGAVIALACSWFLWRFGHSALNAHFLLLFGLAFAVEAVRAPDPRRALAALALLSLGCLLVHAYLFAMNAGLFAVLLPGLALQRRLSWRWAAAALALWLGLAAGGMLLLGYGEFLAPLRGYDIYGLNLLSPLVPQMSGLLPGFGQNLWVEGFPPMGRGFDLGLLRPGDGLGDIIDATGGQYEGLAWLGFGLWPLLLLALWLRRRDLPRLARRGWPLLLAVLAMAVFALGPVVWFGYQRLFKITFVPEILTAFRSSGRFVWPLAYLLAALAVAGVARELAGRRWPLAVLGLLTLIQALDAELLHDRLWRALRSDPPDLFPAETWRPLLAAHRSLSIQPPLECKGADWTVLRLVLRAAEVGRPSDSMYLSRTIAGRCVPATLGLLRPPPPGQLMLLTGSLAPFLRHLLPAETAATCRPFRLGLACTALWPELLSLPPPPQPSPALRAGEGVKAPLPASLGRGSRQ